MHAIWRERVRHRWLLLAHYRWRSFRHHLWISVYPLYREAMKFWWWRHDDRVCINHINSVLFWWRRNETEQYFEMFFSHDSHIWNYFWHSSLLIACNIFLSCVDSRAQRVMLGTWEKSLTNIPTKAGIYWYSWIYSIWIWNFGCSILTTHRHSHRRITHDITRQFWRACFILSFSLSSPNTHSHTEIHGSFNLGISVPRRRKFEAKKNKQSFEKKTF